MPDSWTLVTPTGTLALNPTFAAARYEPGSVATPGAERRDNRATYQRSGDGLRTPGPLTLRGSVWRDDHDHAAILTELETIRTAVATCTQVIRTTSAGTYTYDRLAGGPPPVITPDGLTGWHVTIDLWPGEAAPSFVPSGGGGDVQVLAASVLLVDEAAGVFTIAIPEAPHPPGTLLLLALGIDWWEPTITAAPGLTNLNGQGDTAPLASGAMVVWAFRRILDGSETQLTLTTGTGLYGSAHVTVLIGAGIADVRVATVDSTSPTLPGVATATGKQVFMGSFSEYINI